jgi:hypothetical protein
LAQMQGSKVEKRGGLPIWEWKTLEERLEVDYSEEAKPRSRMHLGKEELWIQAVSLTMTGWIRRKVYLDSGWALVGLIIVSTTYIQKKI